MTKKKHKKKNQKEKKNYAIPEISKSNALGKHNVTAKCMH